MKSQGRAAVAALGLRPHSGWAALVVVAGTARSIEVLDRRRIEIADESIPGSKQPYHAAERLGLAAATEFLERCASGSLRLATRAFRRTLDDLKKHEHAVAGCGILLASGRQLPPLSAVLASHALIHTADGEHFRDALKKASGHFKMAVTAVREKELYATASAALHMPTGALEERINELGRAIGPPWTQDQKLAALVGWLALVSAKAVGKGSSSR